MNTSIYVHTTNRCWCDRLVSSAHIWTSSRLLASGFLSSMSDGLHLGATALSWDAQILLNLYCNDHVKFDDGTCCTSVERASVVQLALLLVFVARFVCCARFIHGEIWLTRLTYRCSCTRIYLHPLYGCSLPLTEVHKTPGLSILVPLSPWDPKIGEHPQPTKNSVYPACAQINSASLHWLSLLLLYWWVFFRAQNFISIFLSPAGLL